MVGLRSRRKAGNQEIVIPPSGALYVPTGTASPSATGRAMS